MKQTHLLKLIAVGFAVSLSSCVIDPYYSEPSHTHVTTVYRPGYEVRTLPSGYTTQTINGTRYYYHDNVYYSSRNGRYVVVDNPRHHGPRRYDDRRDYRDRRDRDYRRNSDQVTIIRTLPGGARSVNYRGQQYYRSGNTYYQSRGNGYVIVTNPY